MNERVSTSARDKVARRNYILFCGAATLVMAVVFIVAVALIGVD